MHVSTQQQMDDRASSSDGPDRLNERKDLSNHVDQLLDNLTANQREVVRLKFQGGLSYQEISRITELSVSNVGYLIHTAIKRLREQLNLEIN